MTSPNINMLAEQHGGNLSWINANYPHAPTPLIDLSTGINPYGYPLPVMDEAWHHRLADSAAMQSAHAAAAQYYGAQHCVLASGMQPLMVALAALRLKTYGASKIEIVSPTYGEHERVWQGMGHDCHSISDIARCEGDVVIVCNPNNPDGRVVAPEALIKLAETLMQSEGWLIVDESFADVLPQHSITAHVKDHPNVVVLRSCGKFFGVAGLRISAAIVSEPCAQWLHTMLGPWPISTAACHILSLMLQDTAWIHTMRSRLAEEAKSWRAMLAEYFLIVGYTDLFTLVESEHARRWFQHLASQGILVRRFDYNERWLRLGLPDTSHMARVGEALKSLS